jgi:hypothetical protein
MFGAGLGMYEVESLFFGVDTDTMLDPLPRHPYAPGTRVHGIREESAPAFAAGRGEVAEVRAQKDGTYHYLVRMDGGEYEERSSPFTIAAGTWPGPAPGDPLFGVRPENADAEAGGAVAADTEQLAADGAEETDRMAIAMPNQAPSG